MFRNTLAAGVVAAVSKASDPYEAYARLVRMKTGVDIAGYEPKEEERDKYDPYDTVPDDMMMDDEHKAHEMDDMDMDMDEDDMMEEPNCKIMDSEGNCFRNADELAANGYHGDPIEIDYTSPVFHAKQIDKPLQCEIWAVDAEDCSGRDVSSKKNKPRPTRRYNSTRRRPHAPA